MLHTIIQHVVARCHHALNDITKQPLHPKHRHGEDSRLHPPLDHLKSILPPLGCRALPHFPPTPFPQAYHHAPGHACVQDFSQGPAAVKAKCDSLMASSEQRIQTAARLLFHSIERTTNASVSAGSFFTAVLLPPALPQQPPPGERQPEVLGHSRSLTV